MARLFCAFALLLAMCASVAAQGGPPVTVIGTVNSNDCVSFNSPNVIKDLGFPCGVNPAFIYLFSPGVNFNSANTDTAIPVSLPIGSARFAASTLFVSNCSHTVADTPATGGLFGTTGGGAPTLAANQNMTVSATGDATNNNSQSVTITNPNTQTYVLANLAHTPNVYFRVGTAEGAATTCDVTFVIRPLP